MSNPQFWAVAWPYIVVGGGLITAAAMSGPRVGGEIMVTGPRAAQPTPA